MGRWCRALISISALSFASSFAVAQEAEPEAKLTFAENSAEIRQIVPSQNGIGITARTTGGFGFIYERLLGERVRFQFNMFYAGDRRPLMAEFKKSKSVGAMDMSESKLLNVSAGIDRFFFLTDDGRWSLITGLAATYSQSEVETKFYRTLCGPFFCGFDLNNPLVDKMEQDRAVSLMFRFGARYSGFKAFEVKTDFSALLVAQVRRSPPMGEIMVPDGRMLKNPRNDGYLGSEIVLGF